MTVMNYNIYIGIEEKNLPISNNDYEKSHM